MFLLRNRVTNEPRTLQRNLCIAAQRTCVACSVPKSNHLMCKLFLMLGFRGAACSESRSAQRPFPHFGGAKCTHSSACDFREGAEPDLQNRRASKGARR